jgi:hypothetical protein
MDEVVATFGFNAGKIWKTLHTQGSLSEELLVKETKLDAEEIFSAIGWLARENKICKTKTTFQLGDTNLTLKIGKDAGKVWKVLNIWDDVDPGFIAKQAHLNEEDVFAALGWLGREAKIQTTMSSADRKQARFRLK